MEMDNQWYLLKVADNEVFGPTPLDQLRIWAAGAKISPMDHVSNDGKTTWIRAAMLPELQMDWLIEMPDNFLYGPTNIGTLQEFLATGEINENVTVINTLDGSVSRISELPFFQASPHRIRGAHEIIPNADPDQRVPESHSQMTAMLKQRCTWLEKQTMELQRDVLRWQDLVQSLRQQFVEATGMEPR